MTVVSIALFSEANSSMVGVFLALLLFLAKEQMRIQRSLKKKYKFYCSQFLVVGPIHINFACLKIYVFVLQMNILMHEYLHCTVGQLKNMFPKSHKSPIISECGGSVK